MSNRDARGERVDDSRARSEFTPTEREWMLRDDRFLDDADREYVVRDARRWRDYVSPVVFGLLVVVLVGDAMTIGMSVALDQQVNPVVAAIVAEVGLAGLVVLKGVAAALLVLVPGVTQSARQTMRAGAAVCVCLGLFVLVTNVLVHLFAA